MLKFIVCFLFIFISILTILFYKSKYRLYNPSVSNVDGKMVVSYRYSNFTSCSVSDIFNNTLKHILKRHYSEILLRVDDTYFKIDIPKNKNIQEKGYEDARIFVFNGNICLLANYYFYLKNTLTVRPSILELFPVSQLSHIQDQEKEIIPKQIVHLDANIELQDIEKNWSPLVHENILYFIYYFYPLKILKYNDTLKKCELVYSEKYETDCLIGKGLRGSSQCIPYKNFYLTIAHTRKNLNFKHYFVLLENKFPFRIQRISFPFIFTEGIKFIHPENNESSVFIQFVCGIDIFDDYLYITYGTDDCHSFITKIQLSVLDEFLNKNEIYK